MVSDSLSHSSLHLIQWPHNLFLIIKQRDAITTEEQRVFPKMGLYIKQKRLMLQTTTYWPMVRCI